MTVQDIKPLKNFFRLFVEKHYTGEQLLDKNIDLKIKHTALVCENTEKITSSLAWPQCDSLIAYTIALFHDIGRFPQIVRYKTFNDRQSFDHALLGEEALLAENALTAFTPREQRLIFSAIRWHNKRSLPAELPPDELPFAQLVRDADKLDILRVVTEYYEVRLKEPNPILEFGLPEVSDCSPEITGDILSGRMCDIANIKNVNDLRLLKLSWIYDLNFDIAKRLFREAGYLEKTIAALPNTGDVHKIQRHLADYLAKY